ncbi:MAG TPA: cupin domain-containing protein [Solirubrobacteraceae bacterium]|nr:cupin domain-containing protein [Solirubrobacteraceae bacterium]
MKHVDHEASMPEPLVHSSANAHWLDPAMTGNPSRIGALPEVPARTMEFYVQEILPGTAGDLQRHRHESVHYVIEGAGYSEIGPATRRWRTGDLVYTPPWVWHRHYNDGVATVRMLLVENSRLLGSLGLGERESAGEVSYAEYREVS